MATENGQRSVVAVGASGGGVEALRDVAPGLLSSALSAAQRLASDD